MPSKRNSNQKSSSSTQTDRHTKFSTRDAGAKCVKVYDRSLNRQVDQKVARKNDWALEGRQDDYLFHILHESTAQDGGDEYDYDGDDESEQLASLLQVQEFELAEQRRQSLTTNHFPVL